MRALMFTFISVTDRSRHLFEKSACISYSNTIISDRNGTDRKFIFTSP